MLLKEIDLDFGKVHIYENVLIARLNEGILFDVQANSKLLQIGAEIFKDRPYAYISHRVNSYAVDPLVYIESARVENLVAIAVVSENEMTLRNAEVVERKFYKDSNSFGVFKSLEEGITWVNSKF